jgi:hypothetical protein
MTSVSAVGNAASVVVRVAAAAMRREDRLLGFETYDLARAVISSPDRR